MLECLCDCDYDVDATVAYILQTMETVIGEWRLYIFIALNTDTTGNCVLC